MSQAYKCDRCKKLFEVNLITKENYQQFDIKLLGVEFDLCGNCQNALKQFFACKTFSPEEVESKIIDFGQHDTNIGLGETIKYAPFEVCNILNGSIKGGDATDETD